MRQTNYYKGGVKTYAGGRRFSRGHGKISPKMHDSNKKNWAKIMKKMGAKMGGGLKKKIPKS